MSPEEYLESCGFSYWDDQSSHSFQSYSEKLHIWAVIWQPLGYMAVYKPKATDFISENHLHKELIPGHLRFKDFHYLPSEQTQQLTHWANGILISAIGKLHDYRLSTSVVSVEVCDECNGTGEYKGLFEVSPCSKGCKPK